MPDPLLSVKYIIAKNNRKFVACRAVVGIPDATNSRHCRNDLRYRNDARQPVRLSHDPPKPNDGAVERGANMNVKIRHISTSIPVPLAFMAGLLCAGHPIWGGTIAALALGWDLFNYGKWTSG